MSFHKQDKMGVFDDRQLALLADVLFAIFCRSKSAADLAFFEEVLEENGGKERKMSLDEG